MQYMVSVVDDTTNSATASEMGAIDEYNDRLVEQNHWVFAGGLASPAAATVVDGRGEEASHTTGPFLNSTEYLAGFWIIEVEDRGTATTRVIRERIDGTQRLVMDEDNGDNA